MEFWDWVLVAVLGGLIVAAILGASAWMWHRRRRPLDWLTTAQDAVERRRRQIARATHDQLVEWVLERAEVIEVQVAVAVERDGGVITVTLHPSGEKLLYTAPGHDTGDLVRAGRVDQRTFGKVWTGLPVDEWSEDKLRAWLTDHAQTPPRKVTS